MIPTNSVKNNFVDSVYALGATESQTFFLVFFNQLNFQYDTLTNFECPTGANFRFFLITTKIKLCFFLLRYNKFTHF